MINNDIVYNAPTMYNSQFRPPIRNVPTLYFLFKIVLTVNLLNCLIPKSISQPIVLNLLLDEENKLNSKSSCNFNRFKQNNRN